MTAAPSLARTLAFDPALACAVLVLALPPLSYGRSSTVVTMIAIGLLFRIHREVHGGQKRFVQRGYVR